MSGIELKRADAGITIARVGSNTSDVSHGVTLSPSEVRWLLRNLPTMLKVAPGERMSSRPEVVESSQ